MRQGDWIQTFGGKQFWPLDPRPEDIEIEDIAHALSNLCRYAGHCLRFYSVAEHCVLLSQAMPDEHKAWALLHDASEAYVVDMPRPVKKSLPQFNAIETELQFCVATRFNLPAEIPAIVHEYDVRICRDEKEQNMRFCSTEWKIPAEGIGAKLQFWPPARAEAEFLRAYERLSL